MPDLFKPIAYRSAEYLLCAARKRVSGDFFGSSTERVFLALIHLCDAARDEPLLIKELELETVAYVNKQSTLDVGQQASLSAATSRYHLNKLAEANFVTHWGGVNAPSFWWTPWSVNDKQNDETIS